MNSCFKETSLDDLKIRKIKSMTYSLQIDNTICIVYRALTLQLQNYYGNCLITINI